MFMVFLLSVCFLGFAVHDHDGLLHQRALGFLAVLDGEDLGSG